MPPRKRSTPPAQADNGTAKGLPPIPVGERIMIGRCPNCLEAVETMVDLNMRYQVEAGGKSTVKATMHTKPVSHKCGQISTLDHETDEVGTRPLDFAERAAGERPDHD